MRSRFDKLIHLAHNFPYLQHLPGIFLSLVIFLSIAGNILVCIAIYTERSLRRIGNLFLASLAVADLFVSSLVMTFAGINDLLGECESIFIYIFFCVTFESFIHMLNSEEKFIFWVCYLQIAFQVTLWNLYGILLD